MMEKTCENGTLNGHGNEHQHDRDRDHPHPLLRGGQPPLPHSFSPAQMEVLTSISDTIFASLPPPPPSSSGNANNVNLDDTNDGKSDPDIHAFYKLSASDWDVPAHAAGLFRKLLSPIQLYATSLAILMLSTKLGTLLLCGLDCFVKKKRKNSSWFFTIPTTYYYSLETFPRLPLETRERVLRRWAISSFFIFQVIFKVLKSTVAWSFFARADHHGHNPAWKAMGYYMPDYTQFKHEKRPLEGKVINVKEETALCAKLRDFGFPVHEGDSYMQGMRKMRRVEKNKKGKDLTVKCDAVVVGSGSGGGVIAGVLAKAGLKILVIEKGEYFARGDFSQIEGPSCMSMLEGPNSITTENAQVLIKAGTSVGGGSTVNWSASLRTPDHVLCEWADEHKLGLFREKRYQQAMDAVCERMQVKVGYKKESFQNKTLREGCEKLGFHVEDVPCNALGEHYCGWCECGCPNGAKQSTAETWLVDAASAGAVILAGCYAEEILLKAGKRKKKSASGVVANVLNGKLYVETNIVVAAGGALNTPLLLRRSGLQNAQIGRNLHLHPTILAWGYRPSKKKGGGEDDDEDRMFEGSLISACSREVGGQKKRDGYGALLQTPSMLPGAFSFLVPWVSSAQYKSMLQRYSRTCVIFTLTRDRTCGVVTEASNGRISVNYSLCDQDKAMSLEALGVALRVLAAAPGVTEIGTMSVHDDKCSPARDDLDAYLARVQARGIRGLDFLIQSAHQMGTCRMGVDPNTSSVDPTCEAWEVEGLFVGDTSVFPTALGVNPMVTVQAIAFCTAHNILNWLKSTRKLMT